MPCACVLKLEALRGGCYTKFTGVSVQGWWFARWQEIDAGLLPPDGSPRLASRLHQAEIKPFTLGPILGLPRPETGQPVLFPAGQPAWIRFTLLQDPEAVDNPLRVFVTDLPTQIELGGVAWRVAGVARTPTEHPWAGAASYAELWESRSEPPAAWQIELATPTLFNGANGLFPFPLPAPLIKSWLRRWNAFCPHALIIDEALAEAAQAGLAVEGYRLEAATQVQANHETVGCTGQLTFAARGLRATKRRAVDALARFAFYCGSGRHTAQGMGLTRPLPAAATMGGG